MGLYRSAIQCVLKIEYKYVFRMYFNVHPSPQCPANLFGHLFHSAQLISIHWPRQCRRRLPLFSWIFPELKFYWGGKWRVKGRSLLSNCRTNLFDLVFPLHRPEAADQCRGNEKSQNGHKTNSSTWERASERRGRRRQTMRLRFSGFICSPHSFLAEFYFISFTTKMRL